MTFESKGEGQQFFAAQLCGQFSCFAYARDQLGYAFVVDGSVFVEELDEFHGGLPVAHGGGVATGFRIDRHEMDGIASHV